MARIVAHDPSRARYATFQRSLELFTHLQDQVGIFDALDGEEGAGLGWAKQSDGMDHWRASLEMQRRLLDRKKSHSRCFVLVWSNTSVGRSMRR